MTPNRPTVLPADPQWSRRAQALTDRLRVALGSAARRIEHIGSTAIPGMAAKDVLDMQVSVADFSVAPMFDEALRPLGFVRAPFERDHVPAGREDDPARWQKRFWRRQDHPDGAVNLHVRLSGSPNERLALLFRDWFRANPGAVPAYARFKQVLAEHMPDTASYADVKDPVVDLIVWMAERWAAETSWRP